MIDPALSAAAQRAGAALVAHHATVAVAEGSCGGLISASLLAVPGASAYYRGGAVIYTLKASRELLSGTLPAPEGLRGATEEFAVYLARCVSLKLDSTWAVGEGGAAGPTANRYGDPAGHAWLAVTGPSAATLNLRTGRDDREANMVRFATAALTLLADEVEAT